MHACMLAITTE